MASLEAVDMSFIAASVLRVDLRSEVKVKRFPTSGASVPRAWMTPVVSCLWLKFGLQAPNHGII